MPFNNRHVSTIVLAAGSGKRMKSSQNKLFLELRGVPILYLSLLRFEQMKMIDSIILVCKKMEQEIIQNMIKKHGPIKKLTNIVEGGEERSDSVKNGLRFLKDQPGVEVILTHDGARPFVNEMMITRLLKAYHEPGIVIPVMKVTDTVRRQMKSGKTEVVERDNLFSTQTPQVFGKAAIDECFFDEKMGKQKPTDEASCFEVKQRPVKLVEGDKRNIKVTAPEDLEWASFILDRYPEFGLSKKVGKQKGMG